MSGSGRRFPCLPHVYHKNKVEAAKSCSPHLIFVYDTHYVSYTQKTIPGFLDTLSVLLIDIIDQPFRCYDFLHKRRECLPLELCAFGAVVDDSAVKINLHFISALNPFAGFRTLDDGEADVDGIAVKNPRKCLCDHAADSGRLDGKGGMFSGRTASKVLICHDDIALLYLVDKILIDVFHAVFCQLCRIG